MTLPAASDRREFLIDSGRAVAAGWLALQVPLLASLQACARVDAAIGSPFKTFTAAEGQAMRAFVAQIVPAEEGLPGADAAGAVYFVDRAVGTPPYDKMLPELRTGLADLDARARAIHSARDFADLLPAEQVAVMRQVEHSHFFVSARTLAVMGTFADPSHGGNKDGVGWQLVGFEHHASFQSPFGWYDAPANRGASGVVA